MKNKFIGLLALIGITYDATGEAEDQLNIKEEHLDALTAKVEGVVELEAAAAKSAEDLKAANDTLEAVTGERDTAQADLAVSAARILDLEAKVEELGGQSGAEKTETKVETQEVEGNNGLPAYCDTSEEIYSLLR